MQHALGQPCTPLTNRACNEFMERVWASPITVPNEADQGEIRAVCADFLSELAETQMKEVA